MTVEGGYRYLKWNREFRDTRETTENTFIAAADVRFLGWAQLRASYEKGSRDRSHYDTEVSEDASFTDPGPLANLPELRRFDQAEKDIDRFNGLLQLTPFDDLSVSLSYLYGHDDFSREPIVAASGLRYGLLDVKNRSFTAEADYSPGERWSVYGFYTLDKISNLQRGRQSGASPSTNPLDDWTSDVDDEVDTFGGGATIGVLPEKLEFRGSVRYQRVDGNTTCRARRAGTTSHPIATYDDTKIWTSRRDRVPLAKFWSLASAAGSRLLTRTLETASRTTFRIVLPAANDGPYQAGCYPGRRTAGKNLTRFPVVHGRNPNDEKGSSVGLIAVLLFWRDGSLERTSSATLPLQKKAKELASPRRTAYCHVEKLRRRGGTHNDRASG